MPPKLNPEILAEFSLHPDRPVRVVDDQTQRVYLVMPEELAPTLWDEYVRKQVEAGLSASDRGDVVAWDIDAMLAAAHQRDAERR